MGLPALSSAAMRLAAASLFTVLAACTVDSPDKPVVTDPPLLTDNGWTPEYPQVPADWPAIPWPADNPYSTGKAILGRRLFFETALSKDHHVSCAWCHDPAVAFTFKHGGLGSGVDRQPTFRGPPTLINVAFATSLMADGRAATLEEQALLPLFSPTEMGMTASEVETLLAADTMYVRLFRQVYGPGPIRMREVARALATYQRTLINHQSPYDAWSAGDTGALSADARAGAALFSGKADCAHCHNPPLFTDDKFHNIGLDSIPVDKGREAFTGDPADEGKFRTPTLRNLSRTMPYMHDGRFQTLEEVVAHYNAGSRGRGSQVGPLNLTQTEAYELVEFLKALDDKRVFENDPL